MFVFVSMGWKIEFGAGSLGVVVGGAGRGASTAKDESRQFANARMGEADADDDEEDEDDGRATRQPPSSSLSSSLSLALSLSVAVSLGLCSLCALMTLHEWKLQN